MKTLADLAAEALLLVAEELHTIAITSKHPLGLTLALLDLNMRRGKRATKTLSTANATIPTSSGLT